MLRSATALSLIALLAACNDGQPFEFDGTETEEIEEIEDIEQENEEDELAEAEDIESAAFALLDEATRLGGSETTSSAGASIERQEAIAEEGPGGGGFLASVEFVPEDDTFIVDGLGFDGENTYAASSVIANVGGYQVFEAELEAPDFLTGDPIGQVGAYRAVYGESINNVDGVPQTSFAIVRTGGFVGYGFGGFIIERQGGVTIPESGQAVFNGDYAGVRVFENLGGLEHTTGDVQIAIDFEDFNTNAAVNGSLTNRAAFDINGVPIPLGGDGELILPDLNFLVQGGSQSILSTGELAGGVRSVASTPEGGLEVYEEGNYYAILSGDLTSGNGGEIVGVLVVESEDPRFASDDPDDPNAVVVTAQETGGFIVYRGE